MFRCRSLICRVCYFIGIICALFHFPVLSTTPQDEDNAPSTKMKLKEDKFQIPLGDNYLIVQERREDAGFRNVMVALQWKLTTGNRRLPVCDLNLLKEAKDDWSEKITKANEEMLFLLEKWDTQRGIEISDIRLQKQQPLEDLLSLKRLDELLMEFHYRFNPVSDTKAWLTKNLHALIEDMKKRKERRGLFKSRPILESSPNKKSKSKRYKTNIAFTYKNKGLWVNKEREKDYSTLKLSFQSLFTTKRLKVSTERYLLKRAENSFKNMQPSNKEKLQLVKSLPTSAINLDSQLEDLIVNGNDTDLGYRRKHIAEIYKYAEADYAFKSATYISVMIDFLAKFCDLDKGTSVTK